MAERIAENETVHGRSGGDEVLATGEGLGSVSVCDCGTISLHVQAMSLRMDLRAFAQATAMMEEAMRALEARARILTASQELPASSALLH